MSVFRVNLSQGSGRLAGGALDIDRNNAGYSVQRTIYVPGPNKINRELKDGDTFTDVNYWKRFATPTLSVDDAFIQVISDDGTLWSDVAADNSFPRSYHLTVAQGSTYTSNVIDVLGDNGSPAIFTQISVVTAGSAPTFRFNGLTNATLSIGDNTTQVFDKGDLQVGKIEINNSQSGSATTTVDVFLSIISEANS